MQKTDLWATDGQVNFADTKYSQWFTTCYRDITIVLAGNSLGTGFGIIKRIFTHKIKNKSNWCFQIHCLVWCFNTFSFYRCLRQWDNADTFKQNVHKRENKTILLKIICQETTCCHIDGHWTLLSSLVLTS